jgi:hypothetical protein
VRSEGDENKIFMNNDDPYEEKMGEGKLTFEVEELENDSI